MTDERRDTTPAASANAGVRKLLSFFDYAHLPPHLQAVSRPYGVLAAELANIMPNNAEATVALRKLLESKDCAVRSVLSP
jgi:hypothetical protein